jgi:hypothetical protein
LEELGFVEWNQSSILCLILFMFWFSLDKAVELDYQWIEFDDVRYHVQV